MSLIYISPGDLSTLNSVSDYVNDPEISKFLGPVDYHYILLSTLYQSGANYFQTSPNILPLSISQSQFWQKKIVDFDFDIYRNCMIKVVEILAGQINFKNNPKKELYLTAIAENLLCNLFYSLRTGNSFVNINSFELELTVLEKGMNRELWMNLKNLFALVKAEKISTVTPIYSMLKSDLNRFEEIASSRMFQTYKDSIRLTEYENNIDKVKKEISTNSLKLFNKYANYLSPTDTAINLLKFTNRLLDAFATFIPKSLTDFVFTSAELMLKSKRTIQFYEIKEITFDYILVNRINELKKNQPDKFSQIITHIATNTKKNKDY